MTQAHRIQKDTAQPVKITRHKLIVLDAVESAEQRLLNRQLNHYRGVKEMNISKFKRIRLESEGNGDGVFVDVHALPEGLDNGFMVTAHNIPSFKNGWARHKVEVRRKERQTALFVYKYDDSEIDEWWSDAEVLYSWTQLGKDDEQ